MDHREIAVRVPVMNEVQFLFASEPCKPLKPRSLYVVFLVEKDVRVERRRTCNYLNHEEINGQYEVCTSSYQKHRNEEEGCIVAFVTAVRPSLSKDVRVERRRTCNYLNHEEINGQ